MKRHVILAFLGLTLFGQEVTSRHLTLYQGDLALLQETRILPLQQGRHPLRIEGLPATFLPSSFNMFLPREVKVISQTHRPWHPSPNLVLAPGRSIQVLSSGKTETAHILSHQDQGERVLQFPDRVEILAAHPDTRYRLPALPQGLCAKPGMDLLLESSVEGPQAMDLSCLVHGLSWSAEYTAVYHREARRLDLLAWARLRNQTGLSFSALPIDLVAGSLPESSQGYELGVDARNAPPPPPPLLTPLARTVQRDLSMGPMPAGPVTLGVHQRYRLPEAISLPEVGAVLTPLLDLRDLEAQEQHVLEFDTSHPGAWMTLDGLSTPVHSFLAVTPQQKGVPLASGRVRTFLQTQGQPRIYLGENDMERSLPGRPLRLALGEASDLQARIRRTGHQVSPAAERTGTQETWDYTVELDHEGTEPRTVELRCTVAGDWTLLSSSTPGLRAAPGVLIFTLQVSPGRRTVCTFRLQVAVEAS